VLIVALAALDFGNRFVTGTASSAQCMKVLTLNKIRKKAFARVTRFSWLLILTTQKK
jgi:hypothetical protein